MNRTETQPHVSVVELVKNREDLELDAYQCPAGIWTIGYGHTRNVAPGDRITAERAEQLLIDDLREAQTIVERAVKAPLDACQLAALASFVFNVGSGRKGEKDGFVTLKNGQPSTMLRKLNAGDYQGAAEEFGKWNKAKGRVMAGLVIRRRMERLLFEGCDWRAALEPERMPQAVDAPAEMKPLAKSTTAQAAAGIGVVSVASAAVQAIAPAAQMAQQVQDAARQAQDIMAQVHQAQNQVQDAVAGVKQMTAIAPVASAIVGVSLAVFVLYRLWRDRHPAQA
ncbi:lysozyme [Azospirillum sp. sgz302134]